MIFYSNFLPISLFPLRDIENKKITVFDSGFNFGKKRRKDILSAHPIIGSNEFINIFIIKYPGSNVNEPNLLIHFSLPYLIW